MTDIEKVTTVQAYVNNNPLATDGLISVYLSDAEAAILHRLYRAFGEVPEGAVMPKAYERLQCKLASRYFVRMGGLGELDHSENGVNRKFGSVNDEDLLMEVMPYARVL